jgi:hypothetical protein
LERSGGSAAWAESLAATTRGTKVRQTALMSIAIQGQVFDLVMFAIGAVAMSTVFVISLVSRRRGATIPGFLLLTSAVGAVALATGAISQALQVAG